MTQIICRASDCIFWEEGACSSEQITYDPENGCLTYEGLEDILLEDEEDWAEDDILDDETLDWGIEEDDLLDLDEDDIDDEWVV